MCPTSSDSAHPRPPRILHVTWRVDASLGGAPAAAIQMARAESANGIHATVVATRARSSTTACPETVDLGGVQGLLFRRDRLSWYSYSHSLGRWLKNHIGEYDMVEIHGIFNYPCLAGGYASRRASIPYVVHPHGQLDPFDLRKHALLKRIVGRLLVRRLLAGARRILTASTLECERLETYGEAVSAETLPLPYEVSDEGADRDAFRLKYELQDRQVVLFLGRIDYKKGIGYLVDAFADVVAHFPNAVLLLVGDDRAGYGVGLRKRVREANLGRCVLFLGPLDGEQKSSALSVAAVLALVSDNENYGLVLVEAAWWGIPVVISREVYIGSFLEAAGAALVVDRNPSAVATALKTLLGDDALRGRMGAEARRLAETTLSWDACASEHAALRMQLINE
jgi:glycosyltransferase involved in cell wall biosynthesis